MKLKKLTEQWLKYHPDKVDSFRKRAINLDWKENLGKCKQHEAIAKTSLKLKLFYYFSENSNVYHRKTFSI
jgi:hypothetical protein